MAAPGRISLLTLGTRGDTAPCLALARALAAAGHDVTVGALGRYQRLVAKDKRLRFVSIGDTLDSFLDSDVARLLADQGVLARLKLPFIMQRMISRLTAELMEGCRRAIGDADLIVHHPLLIFAPDLARHAGIPAIMAAAQPVAPTGAFPLCVLGLPDVGRTLNRATYRLVALERMMTAHRLRAFLRGRGPPASAPPALSTTTMFAYSPTIVPRPLDWEDGVVVTGCWRARPRKRWRLSSELEAFLSDGAPPVYIGFGSMPWNPRRNRDLIVEAVRLWGGRAVIGRGWGGVETADLPRGFFAVGDTPHDLMFPKVAAVVHHGGAGTTATGLAAGRPSFVTPMVMDQPFWGERVHALGAGPPPVRLAKLDPPRLAAALEDLVSNPSYAAAAGVVAQALARENGLAAAVRLVESALEEIEAARSDARAPTAHASLRSAQPA
ncbi:glycosyltransferase [Hansschlegelia plantiphila]|uniref:Glycosyl transferase family 1 n=1 Tax=Hansschlegelia plantiphila TaxID=374655 RepID=A0A9W6IZF0_9HYPH|nr:glycosyltransferase [Hansschlegelia plantiphila]GLK66649.1 glycosyl transferase family 1 [Hansschlegelia plantiphila]